MQTQTYEINSGGETMRFEFNDLALYVNGSVTVTMGNTVVMAVVTMGKSSPYPDGGFPLRVDYQERNYARGAILGSKFNKREGKPTDEATLTSRVIDRTIRPFFPEGFNREVQVVVTVLSLGEYDPDVLAVNAACVALQVSDIPWNGPVGCVRVSQNNDDETLICNPRYSERTTSENYCNAIVAGTEQAIAMIEVEGSEVSHEDLVRMCEYSTEKIAELCNLYTTFPMYQGKKKQVHEPVEYSDTLEHVFVRNFEHLVRASLAKVSDREVVSFWKTDFARQVSQADENNKEKTDLFVEHKIKAIVRQALMEDDERIDGRERTEVRPLYAQAGRVAGQQHGTGIFYRGETHVLSVLTLGSSEDDVLFHHEMEIDETQRWMHHYNFPSYSVGEVGRAGSPGRREIGHGTLAQKALARMLPAESEFPYAIRVVSEVMSSNGSTSMAATCGATLALLDGGVPLKKPVAGIACGLVTDTEGNYKILTDIVGKEDYYGDMDFKVAGTRDGITAIQLDCKNRGISIAVLKKTLEQAYTARMEVLDVMQTEIPSPRELTPYVERITTYKIPDDKVGLVIGKGGVTIKQITKESGAQIDIKRDGTAFITGNADAPAKAIALIETVLKNTQ